MEEKSRKKMKVSFLIFLFLFFLLWVKKKKISSVELRRTNPTSNIWFCYLKNLFWNRAFTVVNYLLGFSNL